MDNLTSEILYEEAAKYFSRINAYFDHTSLTEGCCEPTGTTLPLRVFPEYPVWKDKLNQEGKRPPTIDGCKTTGWEMQDCISGILGLARILIDNNYPQEAILAMLPRDFSLKVSQRLERKS